MGTVTYCTCRVALIWELLRTEIVALILDLLRNVRVALIWDFTVMYVST